ncbi:MAG: hypothetical protein COV45_02245 [Deltaproteobacteria bacterium CG11_big_fil_rev_8_21_14_0_20_47_16]|nr:MAG: hypothetical protein COV45_02245 [Deltaproteobacteria bacterium CG11_big_fil_rev_8_21_14_0_20_47_16]
MKRTYIWLAVLAVMGLSITSHAATLSVTKTDDTADGKCDSDCSLREAIVAANTTPEVDTIHLSPGTYKITLLGADDAGLVGDFDIKAPIEIVGNTSNPTDVLIDGQGKSRVFDVFNNSKLTLKGLRVTGGYADKGACLLASGGGSFDLSHVSFFLCKATQLGGAIMLSGAAESSMDNGAITISDSTGSGGGVFVSNSILKVSNFQLNSNSANQGGAVALDNGAMSVTSSSFVTNVATVDGGAIFVKGAQSIVILKSDTFNGNKASVGGAVALSDGKVTINKSAVFYNTATTQGGGLYLNKSADIFGSTVAANESLKGKGGGIYLGPSAVVNLTNVSVKRNLASEGAGVYGQNAAAGFFLQNDLIVYNVALDVKDAHDLSAAALSKGHNLIGSTNAKNITIQASDKLDVDATIGETGNLIEGKAAGGTYVEVLGLSSAINAGDCAGLDQSFFGSDQLGHVRVGACDVGAIEAVCGDGIVQSKIGEECEDGNANNQDACLNTCLKAICGDGQVQAGVEICDDGNKINDDGCSNTCQSPTCGDGIIQQSNGETCDDGNANNEDGCLDSCVLAKCGDGVVQKGVEECDDGNVVDGDKCSSACKIEKVEPKQDEPLPPVPPVASGPASDIKPGVPGSDSLNTGSNTGVGQVGGELSQPAAATSSSGSCTLIR